MAMSYTDTPTLFAGIQVSFKDSDEELQFITNANKKNDSGEIADQNAYAAFYRQYMNFIFNIANSVLYDEDEAEDVVQEIFKSFDKKFEDYNKQMPFKPWLAAVVRNYCINELKRRVGKPTHYVGSVSADDCYTQQDDSVYFSAEDTNMMNSLESAMANELKNNLGRAIGKLKAEFQEVIALKFFEGMSYEDIAKKLDIPIGTVMSRLFNAKKKLKESYTQEVGENLNSLDDEMAGE
jgi:RNA polymerase sigma-70 factor, ECF subfamily